MFTLAGADKFPEDFYQVTLSETWQYQISTPLSAFGEVIIVI